MRKYGKGKVNIKKRKIKIVVSVTIILISIILVLLIIFISKENKQEKTALIGTWTTDGITIYEFKSDGTGSLKVPSSEYEFEYKTEDNRLYINFENKDIKSSYYNYLFENDTLVLYSDNGTIDKYVFYRI